MTPLRRFWKGESGQDLVEYTLLLGFVILGSAAFMMKSGDPISKVWAATNLALVPQTATSPTTTPVTQQTSVINGDRDD